MERYIEWSKSTLDSYSQITQTMSEYLPNLLGALLFLVGGWLLALLLRFIILKLGAGIDKLIIGFGRELGFKKVKPHQSITSIIANSVFWIVILFIIGTILRTFGWPGLITLLQDYIPRILGSLLIVLSGYIVSNLLSFLIHQYRGIKDAQYAQTLGNGIKLVIVTGTILIALDHLGFNVELFNSLFLIVITFFLLGAALAFGLGARHAISHLVAMRTVKHYYKIGQRVNVDGVEGQVIEIKNHVIILETPRGKAIVPGDLFYEKITLLLESDKNAQ